jgi:hypothetical protein
MCHGGVGLILVMFDVLDCYILYMCLLLFVYCLPVLEAPRSRRQTKQDFFKKILMFVGNCHVAVMFVGEPTNIRPTWHQSGRGTTWRTFIDQVKPTNVSVLGSSVPHGR